MLNNTDHNDHTTRGRARGNGARRPSPALLVSVIALVAGLAGSAAALPGKGSVDRNDLGKGVVRSKALAKNAVVAKHLRDGAVGAADIADAAVGSTEIANDAVGAAKIGDGQVGDAELADLPPASPLTSLGNGGGNDCIWNDIADLPDEDFSIPGVNRPSFYVDPFGIVHLSGVLASVDGPGGDQECDPGVAESDGDDRLVLTLPPAARPESVEVQGGGAGAVLIAPDEGVTTDATVIPPGGVFAITGGGEVSLDGITYRAAGR